MILSLAIVVLGLALAMAQHTITPMLLFVLLVPVCAGFVLADAVLVSRWQSRFLGAWLRDEIDVAAFKSGIRAVPWLPPETIDSLLVLLPDPGASPADNDRAAANKYAVCKALRLATRVLLLKSLLIALSCVAAVILLLYWSL